VRGYFKLKRLNDFFISFCDERELNPDEPIVTHLYLLLGCGLPITVSFIIFDGGFFNEEFSTLTFSGVIFLGVGDVAAALYGRAYGVQKWYKGTKKSQQGSMALWFCCTATFILLSCLVSDHTSNFGFCFFIGSFVVMLFEAFTLQHDNLICSLAYFLVLVHLLDHFN